MKEGCSNGEGLEPRRLTEDCMPREELLNSGMKKKGWTSTADQPRV